MTIKRLGSSPWRRFRFWLWKLFHPRSHKALLNIDEMHTHMASGLYEALMQGSAGGRLAE